MTPETAKERLIAEAQKQKAYCVHQMTELKIKQDSTSMNSFKNTYEHAISAWVEAIQKWDEAIKLYETYEY